MTVAKKALCLLLVCSMAALTFLAGCNTQPQQATAVASDDKYRNFYEIFVYSFCDSDGDGIGDINGITQKLDYLNDGDPNGGDDLGIDGIWLMPIMPSPSYHKYDVTDYYDIHPDYGTLEDFERFTAECEKRGIDVIIDLVLNHTSSEHPWFIAASEELQQGKTDGYAQYYSMPEDGARVSGFSYQFFPGTNYSYECNFSGGMPELNLSNETVREEIKKIMQFWVDKGVSGFRLDAVKYFDSPDTDRVEFMTWLNQAGREMKEDIYFVGEDWDGNSAIAQSYESGMDSMFNFTFSNSGGRLLSGVNSKNAKSILSAAKNWNDLLKSRNENAIDAVFLSNHDMARSANAFSGNLQEMKTAAALYMFMPGNSFIYYGEEVGLQSGTDNDASFRIAMPWSYEGDKSGTVSEPPPGVVEENVELWSPEESAEEQQKNENSLMQFYSKIIDIKLQNPEIARGTIQEIVETDIGNVAGYVTKYEDSSILLLHNLGEEERVVEISKDYLDYQGIRAQLTALDPTGTDADGNNIYPQCKLEGTTLTIPARTTVILK